MSAFLEIVELVNGDIVLQRAGGGGEALMTIRFSEESKTYLPEERLEVARAMIHAGIESASQMEFVKTDDSAQHADAGEHSEGDPADNFERIDEADLSEDRILH